LQWEQSASQAQQNDAGTLALGSLRLLGQLSRIIESRIEDGPGPVAVDSKLQAEIRERKQRQGLKM